MSSPEQPASTSSFISIRSSLFYAFISESYALLNEKSTSYQHVRRVSVRHRAWWLLLSIVAAGILFAHLVWNLAPSTGRQSRLKSLGEQISLDTKGSHAVEFVLPDNIRVIALVSYTARSRTSILDCYLQSNLAINDGLLDQIIFIPDTGQEIDIDWLYTLVQSTPGYYVLGKPNSHRGENFGRVSILSDTSTQVSEQYVGFGPFARAWNLALSTSQTKPSPLETQPDDAPVPDSTPSSNADISSIYIFINGETVFLSDNAISHLLQVHLAHPSYAFTHANMVNQPVLSWIHHHLGVVRPYRPETQPPTRIHRNKTSAKQTPNVKADTQHPWRASELPLWRDSHRPKDNFIQDTQSPDDPPDEQPQDFPPTEEPSLFNIPIDFNSPFRGHRWLPYHPYEHHPLSQSQPEDTSSPLSGDPQTEIDSESISTPVTQAMMSLQRPGKWPWTLSALHLYSFLEHLECTPPYSYTAASLVNSTEADGKGKYQPNCTITGGLDRYNMGLWEYQAEKYGMSFFAIDSRMVSKIGALSNGVSEAEILGRAGKGAVIDGGSVAVRFVGSTAEDGVSETRGLESTDLLERFESVGREVGGCDARDVLR